MRPGFDSPELAATAEPEMGRLLLGRVLWAAMGLVASEAGEEGALRDLQTEADMDREEAERFVGHFRPWIEDMAAALERADSPEDVPDLFAEEVRKRRGTT